MPVSNDIAQHTPTPKPAAKERIGEHLAPATQAASVQILPQPQPQNAVFYKQDGLTLEYYWPLDGLGGLSADETEIFAYNESDGAIEFVLPKITSTGNGNALAQYSGG